MTQDLLEGKRILVVDDEHDVFETIEELLLTSSLVEANTFEDAKFLLEGESFDLAILDIMGVDGYRLLELAVERNVIPVMLTAHALSVKDTVKSFKKGAASYIPKEEMMNIADYLNDILEAREKGKGAMERWFDRVASFYDEKFGPDWQCSDEEFWKKFKYWL